VFLEQLVCVHRLRPATRQRGTKGLYLEGTAKQMSGPNRIDLSDEEVDAICAGLVQSAAKIRYLRRVLHLHVDRRPNGRPLVRRADWNDTHLEAQNNAPAIGPKWSRAP
jgi:hypothetical protein